MADTQLLGDTLAGAFGHGVDRPALNAFVANSQSGNALRSAQTEEAMNNAQMQQEQMQANAELENSIAGTLGPDGKPLHTPSEAHFLATALIGKYGNAQQVMEANRIQQQTYAAGVLGNQSSSPEAQRAAQQEFNGKIAPQTEAVSGDFIPAVGAPATPPVQQTPLAAAQTAAQGANAQLHAAQATNPAAFHPNAAAGGAPLPQQTIDLMGDRFFETGQLPPTGMGNAGMELRKQILQSATQRATGQRQPVTDSSGQGASASIITNAATVGAGKGVVTDMTKRAAVADSSEQTALQNLQLAGHYLNDADQSGSPLWNTIQNKIRGGVMGDPDVAAYQNAIATARDEYARVISMATGAAGITDAARAEGQRLFPDNITPAQFNAVLPVAQQEMNNRTGSLHAQIAGARHGLSAGPQLAPAPPSLPNPANPADQGPNPGVTPDGTTAINRQTGVRMIRKGGIWQLVQ